MRAENVKKKLKIDKLTRLQTLFEEKEWPISSDIGCECFDDFCSMLCYLNDEEQDMIINLTKDFVWIGYDQYLSLFFDVYSKMIQELVNTAVKKVVIFPLLAPKDINNNKSSKILFYLLHGAINTLRTRSMGIEIIMTDNFKNLKREATNDSQVCLIDDFIGSGNTAVNAINNLKGLGMDYKRIIVIALVGQVRGINHIQNCCNNEIQLFVSMTRQRAFSDLPEYPTDSVTKMENIEKRAQVKDDFKFGYMHSEALVKMIRTPNNTFPIYWLSSKLIPIVPFPRE